MWWSGDAFAVGLAAGTTVNNTASVDFTQGGVPLNRSSNTDSFRVDEVLDVTLVHNDAGNVNATSPDTALPLSFTLTNTGNGNEAFGLQFDAALGGDDFNPANVRIYLDDGDGLFAIGSDTLYVSGSNDPLLAADAARVLFVVADIPSGLANAAVGRVSLRATAVTGSGTPGTTFAGAGDAGGDAVVGSSTASALDQNGYVIAAVTTSLLKAQSVLDPLGGTTVTTGSVVTYTLTFSVSGAGSVNALVITDPIPAGTTYVPGSITLDGSPLTDTADGDVGRFTGSAIEVVPGVGGTLVSPATAVVTFKTTIN